jgi:ferredoxin
MSVRINDKCVACGACIWECPTEAITPGDPRPRVNEESCPECFGYFGESQCIVVCPVGAIVVTVESTDELRTKYVRIEPTRAPQDTWIWRRIMWSPNLLPAPPSPII